MQSNSASNPAQPAPGLAHYGLGLIKDFGRLRFLVQVMIRHGFGELVQRSGLAGLLTRAGHSLNWNDAAAPDSRLDTPQRLRLALQELGPAFIKLGQILATRADLLEPEWIMELERLQDQVEPVDFAVLRPQLEEDLGAAPEALFDWFDPLPLATASIGQVHRARLADGREVILKIRRPGIRPQIEADLRLLALLAELAEHELPGLARFHPVNMVRQFATSLRQELDLAAECRNAQRVAGNFAGNPHVRVPEVYWDWTCERVNVQEFVPGIPARNLAEMQAAGLDSRVIASRGTQAVLKMVLEDGFFHADPHAGNLFVMPENSLVFIDWGMVGRLSEARRRQVIKLFLGLVERDARSTTEVLVVWAGDVPLDQARLMTDVEAFTDRYHGVPLRQLRLAELLGDVTRILRGHQLALPSDLAMMIKAVTTLEGLGRQLNPDFQIVEEATPVLRRLMLNQLGPQAVMRRGWTLLTEGLDALSGLPGEVHGLTRAARNGQLRLGVEVRQIEEHGRRLGCAANRIAIGLVTAACILAVAILAPSSSAPSWMANLALLGAGLGGFWLLRSIWRGEK